MEKLEILYPGSGRGAEVLWKLIFALFFKHISGRVKISQTKKHISRIIEVNEASRQQKIIFCKIKYDKKK